jgi:hypothetical protein
VWYQSTLLNPESVTLGPIGPKRKSRTGQKEVKIIFAFPRTRTLLVAKDMQSQSDQDLGDAEQLSFTYTNPRLLSHKPKSQVIQCDYTDKTGSHQPCIVKLFSPRARVAFENEVALYSMEKVQKTRVVPSKIWSGLWTVDEYQALLGGKLPSMLRRPENQVKVLVLSFIEDALSLSHMKSPYLLPAVEAALFALRRLHRVGVVHGDPSADNVLMHAREEQNFATWVDFSSSVAAASDADIDLEWRKAIEYYSQRVYPFRRARR